MAVEAITWALQAPIKRSATKFVLTLLGNCADGDSWEAFPSIAYIADCTALDRKTVVAALRFLCAEGYISDTGDRRGQTKQIPIYRLNRSKTGTVEQNRKRNAPEIGTVPRTDGKSTDIPHEQSRFSPGTIPKTEHGTVSNRKGTVKGTDLPAGFAEFWNDYPRKVARPKALQAWKKLMPDAQTLQAILCAVERDKRSDQWQRNSGQFIPHPATWLNGRRWEDEMPEHVPPHQGGDIAKMSFRAKPASGGTSIAERAAEAERFIAQQAGLPNA